MIVSKCSATAQNLFLLSFDKMCENEGVYIPDAHPLHRIIIIKHVVEKTICVIFYDSATQGLAPASAAWKSRKFVKTDETVCFGLKPAA